MNKIGSNGHYRWGSTVSKKEERRLQELNQIREERRSHEECWGCGAELGTGHYPGCDKVRGDIRDKRLEDRGM